MALLCHTGVAAVDVSIDDFYLRFQVPRPGWAQPTWLQTASSWLLQQFLNYGARRAPVEAGS